MIAYVFRSFVLQMQGVCEYVWYETGHVMRLFVLLVQGVCQYAKFLFKMYILTVYSKGYSCEETGNFRFNFRSIFPRCTNLFVYTFSGAYLN